MRAADHIAAPTWRRAWHSVRWWEAYTEGLLKLAM
jgi:hypothetical protein